MSEYDLQKRREKVEYVLTKRKLTLNRKLRVGVALDVSESAKKFYDPKGRDLSIMQATANHLVPVAMRFDDNGEMDVWSFDDGFTQLSSVTPQNYEDYIARVLMRQEVSKWGGTRYAPVIQSMLNFYFGDQPRPAPAPVAAPGFFQRLFGVKPALAPAPAPAPAASNEPAMGLFITDGQNADRTTTRKLLIQSQNKPIYWQLIGVGREAEFEFLDEMARLLPNVGYVNLASLELTDEQLYDTLLTQELVDFINKLPVAV